MQIGLVALLALAVAAGIYFFVQNRAAREVSAFVDREKGKYTAQGDSEELARAKAAEEAAQAALKAAQDAERNALVEEQAAIVRSLENRLKELETAAILQPTDPTIARDAAEAEALAEQERAELERRWRVALADAEAQMVKISEAARIATEAYATAKAKVAYWERQVAVYKNAVLQSEATLVGMLGAEKWFFTPAYREQIDKLKSTISGYKRALEMSEKNVVIAKNDVIAVRIEVVSVIATANNVIEAALRLTADIRILGILLALASRVDGIAQATRTKLAELEGRLV